MLSVKWCVTDEAAQVTLCTQQKTPHTQVEVNSGNYSTFLFHPLTPSSLRTLDDIKLGCHGNLFEGFLNTN